MGMPEILEMKQWGAKGRAYISPKTFHQRLASLGADLEKGFADFLKLFKYPSVKKELRVKFL